MGETFSCVPYTGFDLGKHFPQLQDATDHANLEMFFFLVAVSGEASAAVVSGLELLTQMYMQMRPWGPSNAMISRNRAAHDLYLEFSYI